MLHHVSVGVMNVERAARFYDNALGALGYRRVMEFMPYGIGYGDDTPVFWVQLPHNQSPATVGNGVHIGFVAATKEMIVAFHRAALDAGGVDEGAPGPRPDYGPDYYGAFVRDLDGNKLEAVLVPKAGPARAGSKAKRKTAKARKKRKSAAPKAKPRAKKKKGGAAKRRRR
jgi:catechol 2,3-dioxygenase-like lactoylglutathione lyase family enzyme